jgi:molybdopterin-guanine dinucleotide biosynthesis protein A
LKTSGLIIALGHGEEGLVELNQIEGLPVFLHAIRNLGEVAEEIAVAVTRGKIDTFTKVSSEHGFEEFNFFELNHPEDVLSVLKEGLSMVNGEIVVTAPANAPLIPLDILSLLTELCEKRDAVLIRNFKGGVDWFLSAYNRRSFMKAVEVGGTRTVEEAVNKLRRVMYISHSTLKDLDPMLFSSIRVTRASEIPVIEKLIRGARRRLK